MGHIVSQEFKRYSLLSWDGESSYGCNIYVHGYKHTYILYYTQPLSNLMIYFIDDVTAQGEPLSTIIPLNWVVT